MAILDIDEVIQLIRSSDDAAQARERLMSVFDLTDIQTTYILDMPLRRLTKFSRLELEKERDELSATIETLTALLEDEDLQRKTVSDELAEVAKTHGTPRRTVLLESAGQPVRTTASTLEVADDPCHVLLSSTGLLARTSDATPLPTEGARAPHDAVPSAVTTTARGEVGVVTSAGRVVRLSVIDLPALPGTAAAPSLAGGAPISEFLELDKDERPLALCSLLTTATGLALGTEQGVVKRVTSDYPTNRDSFEVIGLREGDRVVGAVDLVAGTEDLVFITSDAQLLRFGADAVRPQGRPAGGMAGVRVTPGERVVFFGAVPATAGDSAVVVTVSGSSAALPGTEPGSIKVTPYADYPGKGRGTGGVRAHRFLKGEDTLTLAWAGATPARAAAANGVAIELPPATGRRDGSGTPAGQVIAAVASPVTSAAPPA